MTNDRIKEIQSKTAYPDSISVQQGLLQVWNECEQEQSRLHNVSVSLPSVDDAGIIALEIADINNKMTAQEQAFFIAGFSECIKYLGMQNN